MIVEEVVDVLVKFEISCVEIILDMARTKAIRDSILLTSDVEDLIAECTATAYTAALENTISLLATPELDIDAKTLVAATSIVVTRNLTPTT